MIRPGTHERYLDNLLKGDRKACRTVIEETLQTGTPANSVYLEVIWPIMAEIEQLIRDERITPNQEHLATRINRTIVDQLQNKLPRRPSKNKKIVVSCAPDELQELGAQIMADLFESDGWNVKFLGGGLTNDDILAFVNQPGVRQLIDTIRNINAWPEMRIMVSGGLFNRAEGLWQEIGADLFAATALEAIQVASSEPGETPRPTFNRRKQRQKQAAQEQAVNIN